MAAAAPAPARALDPKRIITATSFGPYKAGEKITKKLLEAKFGMTFESEASMENPEDGSTTPARWRAEANETVGGGGLAVTKENAEWQVWLETFYDAHGIGPGTPAAQLVGKIADLKCEHYSEEEPIFECWSAAAPNLRYGGAADHELATGFTKQTLVSAALTVSYLKWQPPTQ